MVRCSPFVFWQLVHRPEKSQHALCGTELSYSRMMRCDKAFRGYETLLMLACTREANPSLHALVITVIIMIIKYRIDNNNNDNIIKIIVITVRTIRRIMLSRLRLAI